MTRAGDSRRLPDVHLGERKKKQRLVVKLVMKLMKCDIQKNVVVKIKPLPLLQ